MSLSAIETRTLSEYLGSNNRKLRNDRKRGRQDGQRQFPSAADDFYPFLDEAVADARKALQDYDTELDRHIDVLSSRRQRLENERDEEYARRRGDLISEKHNRLNDLERLAGPSSERVTRTGRRYEDAEHAYRNLQIALNRPVRTHWPTAYLPVLFVLFLFEAPLNRLAFELFFQETAVISWGLAAIVGALFLTLAHFAGVWMRRQGQHRTLMSRLGLISAIAAIVAISGAMMYFIAKVRQGYLLFLEGERTINSDLSALLRGDDLSLPGFGALLDVPLDHAGYMLILINFVIFLVAGVLSFVRHDPHPDYEKLERRKERAERELSALNERFARDCSRVSREYDERIQYLDKQIDSVESELQRANAELASAEQARVQNRLRVAKFVNTRLTHYQSGNIEGRVDNKISSCFRGWSDEDILERVAIVITISDVSDRSAINARERAKF